MQFLEKGILYGQTAYNIFLQMNENIKIHQNHIYIDEFHIRLDSINYNSIKDGNFNHFYKVKKISNCKLQLTTNINKKIIYYIYKELPGAIKKYFSTEIKLNFNIQKINLENIIIVVCNILLEPLLNLRKCQSISEALMNWSLNNNFMVYQNYLNYRQLIEQNIVLVDQKDFKEIVQWFMECSNIINFVPKRFICKVKRIHLSKNQNLNSIIEFMDIITNINKYFIKMVRNYYEKEHIYNITSYDLIFSFELYGNKEDIYHPKRRKSLYLVRKNKDYLHLKSFAIIFNLRWFFNTRYNYKKSLGFDKEYGRTVTGYGQTFHKYNDVLLWLVTHPNTIDDVELVVLDPIPPNYIF